MKKLLFFLLCIFFNLSAQAQEDTTSYTEEELQALQEYYQHASDSIENTLSYEYGTINLGDDLATIEVPEGFKFLDKTQAQYILSDLWENPSDESTLGLLFPIDSNPLFMDYAIEISYIEEGHIEDEDASSINYYELMDDMKESVNEENKSRQAAGYPMVDLIGWAAKPYYDATSKKLYWAKELKFEESEMNTLNYNIRVLGRKGYLMLNYIADIDQLDLINNNIDPVLNSIEFNAGNRYRDFDSSIDKVAAYGIGGLIAGKILAKAGFFALLVKFWKVIALAVVGGATAVRKFFKGKKEQQGTTPTKVA